MTTIEERREIAAKLREYAECDECESCDECEDACTIDRDDFGNTVLTVLHACGESYRTCYDRLADLIEPSCDRAALLVQVEELEKCAWYFGLDFDADEPLRDRLKEASEDFVGCARRIREAVGA